MVQQGILVSFYVDIVYWRLFSILSKWNLVGCILCSSEHASEVQRG